MRDDRRSYSDEEFALILRKASELAESDADPASKSDRLTLAEMKAAAAQAGFDPALVERAARLVRTADTEAPSLLERVIGGRLRHGEEAHLPIVLDEAGATRFLSAVRIAVGRAGDGHAGPTGLTWQSAEDGGAVLRLTALASAEGTAVSAELDRRGTVALVGVAALVGSVMALLFGATVVGEILPGLEPVGALAGVSAVLGAARSYWVSSTKAARKRLDQLMDSINPK